MSITNLLPEPSYYGDFHVGESPSQGSRRRSQAAPRNRTRQLRSQSPSPSQTDSDVFSITSLKAKRRDTTDSDDSDDSYDSDDSSNYTKKSRTKQSVQARFSVTSDHKPVFMEFELEGISEPIVALTYNMSFASDLGRAVGSEADFVQRAINADPSKPRAYWINAANLVKYFVYEKRPTIMYFQEMNDRNQISTTFEGGYQALLELLAKPRTISSPTKTFYSSPPGSYSITGTYQGIDDNKN
jgi:hypothetical protein